MLKWKILKGCVLKFRRHSLTFYKNKNLIQYNKINDAQIIKIYPKRVTEEIHKIFNYSHIHLKDRTKFTENFNYHSTHQSKFIVGTSIRWIVIAYKQAKSFCSPTMKSLSE